MAKKSGKKQDGKRSAEATLAQLLAGAAEPGPGRRAANSRPAPETTAAAAPSEPPATPGSTAIHEAWAGTAPALPLSATGCNWLAGYLAAASLFFLAAVVSVWPESPATSEANGTPETSLLLLTLYAGGLGACVHALQSFMTFMGNRRLAVSWVPWYVLRPLIGMSLAVLGYAIVRLGLLGSSPAEINPAGMAAVGGLAGLFSKRALQKLSEVSETLFRVQAPHEERDGLPRQHAQQPTESPDPRGDAPLH